MNAEDRAYERWFTTFNKRPDRTKRQFYVIWGEESEYVAGPYTFSDACAVANLKDAAHPDGDDATIYSQKEVNESDRLQEMIHSQLGGGHDSDGRTSGGAD